MAPENAICNKARECLAAFNHCIESMTSTPWPQDQLDRFNLWAAHGGIFGSYQGRTSMDWRLRERPELVDMMLQLLDLLHEYLSAIYTLADPVSDPVSDLKFHAGRTITATQDAGHQTQPPSSHTSASTSSSECSFGLGSEKLSVVADPVDTMRGKVEQTIAELFRISAAIRSAGMSYRYTKAANFVEWQDGVNLTLRFKEGVELLLRYKKPSPSDYMVKRLVETVCLRQRELAYSRRKGMGRSGKEATEESIKSDGVASLPQRSTAGYPGQCGSGSTMSKITPTAIGASREKTAQPNTVQSTIYTATYVPTTVFPQAKPVKTLITRPQWRTIDDSLTNLPLSPEVGATLEFECPYCAIPFERTKFQGSSWRNHVLEDLRPYICILPDCITPHALYQDSISWISHMQTKHKVVKWKCVSSCHPEIQAFSTEAEFLAHTEFEHKEDFTTEEMLELANLGRYEITRELEVDILPKCPICMISFESEDFLSVYSHIAEDLVDYARISLPESPHADANSSQEDSSKSASVDDGRIGQRRESEIEANRMFPWSLWDFDSPETRGDLDCYDDGLNRIPDPSNTDVAVLAEIRYDICNARHKRLQKKPDHNLHLLRQYREEPNPHKDEDMTFFFKDPALHTKTASNLPDHQSQSSVEDSQSEKTDEGVTTIPMLQSFNDHTHLRKNHTGIVYENYTVGWICAIITEYVAARQFLDEEHEGPVHVSLNDNNDYTLGKIGKHNVVITVLPPVDHGASPAASVAREMLHSFPNMRFCLIVGIGSGAPSKGHDIRLGDIVVGTPRYGEGGVLPYDFGRTIQHRSLQHIGVLNQPPTVLLEAVNELQAKYEINGHRFGENIDNILRKMPRLQKKYSRPDPSSDRLYQSKIMHSANSDSSCVASCGTDPSKLIQRTERTQDKDNPVIHYGVIASGDQLMEDASVRDKLAAEEDILCFEMGAAGLINQFPCLVVCGICDYSDSHKNMEWQGYAAMAAAAYAKDLLCQITLAKVEDEKTFGDILSGLHKIQGENLDIAKEQLQTQKEQECHQLFCLTTDDSGTYEWYKDRVEERDVGTCLWFLQHEHFQSWLKQETGPLLVTADPGCGKSVLAKYLIDHALPRSTTICYFFFKYQDQNTVRQALCALLHQLFSQKPLLIKHAMAQYIKDEQDMINRTESLWKILRNAIKDPKAGPIVIVLDAVDECAESDFLDLMRNVESQFHNDQSGQGKFKYLLTCRPYERIISKFSGLLSAFPISYIPGEEESDHISQEVNRVITRRVNQLSEVKHLPSMIKSHLERRLQEITHRTYLWVYLVFESLEKTGFKKTLKGIDSMIANLPRSIIEAYEQILNQCYDKGRQMARKVFSIILAARRPLALSEMNVAVNIDARAHSINDLDLEDQVAFKSRLRSWCGLFISVHHNKIYFLHESAREFLLAQSASPIDVPSKLHWHHSITIWDAHAILAEVCVLYLNFFNSDISLRTDVYRKASQSVNSRAFLAYSAQTWGSHFREARFMDDASIVPFAMRICDTDSESFSAWFKIYWKSTGWQATKDFTDLMVAAHFGHNATAKVLVEKGAKVNAKDSGYNRTPLLWAAGNGHEAVVKLLVENGADIEAQDKYGLTALLLAAENGHEAVVTLLLDRGANVWLKDKHGQTALLPAAGNGHEAVVKLLVENGADIEAQDKYGQKALLLAAENGHEAVVKLLLDRGANVWLKDEHDQTALLLAAKNGHKSIVKLLVEKGADVKAQDKYGQTALLLAAENGHKAIVKLLVERGVNIEAKHNKNGWTALLLAAKNGHEAVVRLLVEKGADIEAKHNNNGWTALCWAAENRREAVVKLLLDWGANVEAKDQFGQTALLLAAKNGHVAVVKLLVEKGADVEAKHNNDSRTALWWAAKNRREAVVKLLLNMGADIEAKNQHRQTALLAAAEYGHIAVVKLLVEQGADVEAKDIYSQTALLLAATNGHKAVVKLLQRRSR